MLLLSSIKLIIALFPSSESPSNTRVIHITWSCSLVVNSNYSDVDSLAMLIRLCQMIRVAKFWVARITSGP